MIDSNMTDATKELDFNALDKLLVEEIDKEVIGNLDYWLEIVRAKSKALASSLKRCFNNAKNSERYLLVYKLGKEDALSNTDIKEEELEEYLENYLKDYFEKNDFMHYREFVRLLRACTIDLGGDVSSEIKKMYNNFFLGKRLIKAYMLGRELKPKF